jgi:hydroxylamine reductase
LGYPGLTYLLNSAQGKPDLTPAIEAALALPGFTADQPHRSVMTGFARQAVLSLAESMVAAVKAGKIRHFFLVGGCDGAKPDRNYYTDSLTTPWVILMAFPAFLTWANVMMPICYPNCPCAG